MEGEGKREEGRGSWGEEVGGGGGIVGGREGGRSSRSPLKKNCSVLIVFVAFWAVMVREINTSRGGCERGKWSEGGWGPQDRKEGGKGHGGRSKSPSLRVREKGKRVKGRGSEEKRLQSYGRLKFCMVFHGFYLSL